MGPEQRPACVSSLRWNTATPASRWSKLITIQKPLTLCCPGRALEPLVGFLERLGAYVFRCWVASGVKRTASLK
jgi:hypothetical protein